VSDTPKYAVSIRLDTEAQRNLNLLEASGLSRSEAIRKGLQVAADQLRRSDMIYAEAQMASNHQHDRREMLEIAAFMESHRGEG
jgi:Arc/MetJ-type ribon-helix-helix transcriptional regulator